MTSGALRVRLGGRRAATAALTAHGLVLTYEADCLAFVEAVPLSLSLRLRAQPHEGRLVTDRLDGLLPDLPTQRDQWRRAAGAASSDAFDLLASPIGSECAGAVQFERAEPGDPDDASRPESALVPVSDAELADIGGVGGVETLVVERFDRAHTTTSPRGSCGSCTAG